MILKNKKMMTKIQIKNEINKEWIKIWVKGNIFRSLEIN